MAASEQTQPIDRVLDALRHHGHEPRQEGNGWKCTCPSHEDRNPSLSISLGDNGGAVIHCHANCAYRDVLKAIGLNDVDLFPPSKNGKATFGKPTLGRIVATYDYTDESGKLLYQAVRYDPKDFRQRRPDPGKPGAWTWKLGGLRRVPYRLVALRAEHTENHVYIVEGEKDADNLDKLGFVATCNAQGAGKWHTLDTKTVADAFHDRRVVILPDNDSAGRSHGIDVANRLRGIAAEIRIVELPGLPDKGDVSDWLKAGGNADELRRLVDACPLHSFSEPTPEDASESDGEPPDDDDPETLNTDVGNGRRFVEDHGDVVRSVPGMGYMVWDGKRWKRDDAGQAQELAKKTVARMYSEAADKMAALAGELREIAGTEDAILSGGDEEDNEQADRLKAMLRAAKKHLEWAIKSEDARRISAMLKMASTDTKIVAAADDFDRDDFLLNVRNGTINLKTGELRPHDQNDLITRLAKATYDPNASSELWSKTLLAIFAGDVQLIQWFRRCLGYICTGDVCEQIIIILHGSGGNGKSLIIELLLEMLGDYAMKANTELFLASKNDRHETEKAGLAGRRFVAAVETGEGRRLNEPLVKEATGGDRIRARFLYQDYFEFSPKFKLTLATNFRPEVRGTDMGIWRRVRLVPFTQRFWKEGEPPGKPELKADVQLKDKLRLEAEGVFAWIVTGAIQWAKQGLGSCPAVEVATAEYRDSEDVVKQFVEEQCEQDSGSTVRASELFGAYKVWAEKQNEKPFKQTTFGRRIGEMGFDKAKSNGVVWIGLRLRHTWNSGTV